MPTIAVMGAGYLYDILPRLRRVAGKRRLSLVVVREGTSTCPSLVPKGNTHTTGCRKCRLFLATGKAVLQHPCIFLASCSRCQRYSPDGCRTSPNIYPPQSLLRSPCSCPYRRVYACACSAEHSLLGREGKNLSRSLANPSALDPNLSFWT